jgi:two-component system sensor histidine kinase MprB
MQLGAVAGIGLAAAILAGLVVARAALHPVRRFTEIVEHIARTDDLGTRVTVTGQDEIARLGVSFNDMTAALDSARTRQQRLVSDAGHELRTPLTSLRTAVDLLLRSERTGRTLPEQHRRTLLTNADSQINELSHLVTDLLRLSWAQESSAATRTRTAFHDVVERAVRRVRPRGPGLEFAVTIEPCHVLADPASLERAVLNLLDNAVKFSPPGGLITVCLAGGECTITDQGPGIAPGDLPRVFDRFWRSDSARSLPGSGLGLAIVAQCAAEAGGTVTLERISEAGRPTGTLVRLRIPLDDGTPRAEYRPEAVPEPASL